MEISPLTLQARPDVFQNKVVSLYKELFSVDDDQETTEGFWRVFFLLKPDKSALLRLIDALSPEDFLSLQTETQQLFNKAVKCIRAGKGPADLNALETCTALMAAIFRKKYTNPSSDVIDLLAGLDQVDKIFTDFVAALDITIRNGRSLDLRQKAVESALCLVSGAYQTSLLSYFIYRDLFLSLMKFIQDSETISRSFRSFILLGLLANYNKFEFQNPYQLRLDDFVNEATIQKIIRSVGYTCSKLRGEYVAIQNDSPEGWSISNTLSMMGLSAIAPRAVSSAPPVFDAEVAKEMFAKLPGSEAAVLLATYDFTNANKLFCLNLISLPAEKDLESPISSLLSLISYLLQHAHTSSRTTNYSHLCLLIIRILVEDQTICKQLCSDENKITTRLCRQKSPYLPYVHGDRSIAAILLDAMLDGINHNLRRRLDVDLYILCIGIIYSILSYLSRSRTRLKYHWSELYRSLLSLVRFLTTYTSDLRGLKNIDILIDNLVNLIALSLCCGEAFLHSPVSHYDLFYKVVEMGEVLVKFRDNFSLEKRPKNSIDTLISVSAHYNHLLQGSGSEKKKKNLTSTQVASVIKQGYESLSIQAKDGLENCEKYREADKKAFLKQVSRCVVADVKNFIWEGLL
ncbi:putative chromosome 10 open reading frame 76 [Erysiphe necator]|uniref:Putative chromosome 10 open reading frame 76 n=1 Tax=Uncinula necator TaxID=52586 RepID=A0A0B1PAG4_UNCNE|nr:putative chromosome 10 open reading frame 76 [Erysiphe necator]